MNPSYPFYFNIDPDQTDINKAQDRYRPGQLFWRRNQSENHQQIAENTFVAMLTVLAPFQLQLQPMFAQAGSSGSLPLAPACTPPPTTPEPQDPSKTDNPGRAGRGYGKWRDEEDRLLVQLWCDKHMRPKSRHARQVWEEIAQEVSKLQKVSRKKEQEEDDTIFREGMQKLQEQGDRIIGVLKSMGKKSSSATSTYESVYEQFYASHAIIKQQSLTQNSDHSH